MSHQLLVFSAYCARMADRSTATSARLRAAAERLEAKQADPFLISMELAASDQHRRDAALWRQIADEISAYLAQGPAAEGQGLW